MTYTVVEAVAGPTMVLTPDTTVYTGTAVLDRDGLAFVRAGEPPQDFGFFVPDTHPLGEDEEAPSAFGEAFLMAIAQNTGHVRHMLGVEQVTAGFLPDPRGGPARWLHLGGLAFASSQIRIGYRITVQNQ